MEIRKLGQVPRTANNNNGVLSSYLRFFLMIFFLLVAGACKCNKAEKNREDAPPLPTLGNCLNAPSFSGKDDVILALIEHGLFAEALECVKAEGAGIKLTVIKDILKALNNAPTENMDRLSLLSNMLELTKSLDNIHQKKEAIGEIIKALPKANPNESQLDGFVRGMIEILRADGDPSSLYWAAQDICELIKGTDNADFKTALFKSVLRFIDTIENRQTRWEAARSTVRAMAQNGFFDEALASAENIKDQDPKDYAISDIVAELAKAAVEPVNKLKLLKIALEMVQDSDAKNYTIGNIAVAMAKNGFFDESLAAAQMMDAPDAIVYRDIAVEMVRAGRSETEITDAIKRFFDLLKIRDWNSTSVNHNNIESIDAAALMDNHRLVIPILVDLLATQTTETNPWHARNVFERPCYEAAMVIGLIAREARKYGNAEALQFIRTFALPKLIELMKFSKRYSRNQGGDFFNQYVLLPMRMTLLEALANIGDASIIPEILSLKDDLYHFSCAYGHCSGRKPIHIGKMKESAVEYLQTQASNNGYLDPPCFFSSEGLIDWE